MTGETPPPPVHALPAHRWLGEPLLRFNPLRPDERRASPLQGLLEFGPFSRNVLTPVMDPIRVAIIGPHGELKPARDLVAELARPARVLEGKPYRPDYPGYRSAFSLNIAPAAVEVELPAEVDRSIQGANPHLALADHVLRAVQHAVARREHFDVLLIYLPDRWEPAESVPNDAWFLHDQIKAAAARHGVATQIVRQGEAISYRCRASVLWHLAIALYVKAGGVPWKLAEPDEGTAYIGLGYALRPPQAGQRFVICCSQIFDSDGAGLEFLLYETGDMWVEGDDPFLSRKEMRRVIGRSIQLYQRRTLGRIPRRLVVHKTSLFKDMEAQGVFDAAGAIGEIELVQVQATSPWRGIHVQGKQDIARYPVERGTFLQLSGSSGLLWTSGNAPTAVPSGNYYKEGRAIPEPLEIIRFAGRSSLDEAATAVLALTKMDWNKDALYDRMPVTTAYAKVLARVAKNFTEFASVPYPLRLFM
jgi:hypothetical protein